MTPRERVLLKDIFVHFPCMLLITGLFLVGFGLGYSALFEPELIDLLPFSYPKGLEGVGVGAALVAASAVGLLVSPLGKESHVDTDEEYGKLQRRYPSITLGLLGTIPPAGIMAVLATLGVWRLAYSDPEGEAVDFSHVMSLASGQGFELFMFYGLPITSFLTAFVLLMLISPNADQKKLLDAPRNMADGLALRKQQKVEVQQNKEKQAGMISMAHEADKAGGVSMHDET